MAGKLVPIERRFWTKVEKGEGCWLWTGSKDARGYGRIGGGGAGAQPLLAHRVAWELSRGPIPEGLVICHHCDNPSCVNPDHLFMGTMKRNSQDASEKSRLACGERHYRAKLTVGEVRAIRKAYVRSSVGVVRLGKAFGVDDETVRRIVKRRAWKHVKETA